MGSGSWTHADYVSYSTSKGYSVTTDGTISTSFTVNQNYTCRTLADELNAYKKVRDCLDTAEHPNTIPVILALDVTGSMGTGAVEVAKRLGTIMTNLYEKLTDVEFCIMGIGDIIYDSAPIQMSQFESDIRIAQHLDKLYFEAGGGGNSCESYAMAWYMGLNHTNLDCWKRGKKGIIITLGDEAPDKKLYNDDINKFTGDEVKESIDTTALLEQAQQKFDIFHLSVNDSSTSYSYHQKYHDIDKLWADRLGNNYKVVNLDSLSSVISSIIIETAQSNTINFINNEISW